MGGYNRTNWETVGQPALESSERRQKLEQVEGHRVRYYEQLEPQKRCFRNKIIPKYHGG